MNEKRQSPRIEKKFKSEVHSQDGMTFSTTIDMSSGGIFISTPEPVEIGSEVNLSIKLSNKEEIEIKGIVRWMDESEMKHGKAGMGIEFVELNSEQKDKINNIIKST
ncbi:MAG: PilZ domain-containing protein [Spirochaetes bacterium]|nr:PilZ domain-containing protein [Spirochaetota bacterium]